MADQNITALPVKTVPAAGDQIMMLDTAEGYIIDYDKLADAVLGKLSSKTYALDQGTKSLVAALNELNSKTEMNWSRTDLNNLTDTASGYCSGCTNTPAGVNGYLTILSPVGSLLCKQTFENYQSKDAYKRQRLDNGTWTKWTAISNCNTAVVLYRENTKDNAVNALDNPTTLFGAKVCSYTIIFDDNIGDSPFTGGRTCVYGYTYSADDYGAQFAIRFDKKGFITRNKRNNVWSDWQ